MAQKTTIVLPETTHRRVKQAAAERDKSMGEFIREAIEEKLKQARPKPRSIGIADSGRAGIAERASDAYRPDPWHS